MIARCLTKSSLESWVQKKDRLLRPFFFFLLSLLFIKQEYLAQSRVFFFFFFFVFRCTARIYCEICELGDERPLVVISALTAFSSFFFFISLTFCKTHCFFFFSLFGCSHEHSTAQHKFFYIHTHTHALPFCGHVRTHTYIKQTRVVRIITSIYVVLLLGKQAGALPSYVSISSFHEKKELKLGETPNWVSEQ